MAVAVGIVALVAAGVGMGIFALREVRIKRNHIANAGAIWLAQGREVQAGPVAATYYGSEPQQSYASALSIFGVLGVVDGKLCFERSDDTVGFSLEPAYIRWLGTHLVRVKDSAERNALVIHHEIADRWQMAVFVVDGDQRPILDALSALSGVVPEHELRKDFGPGSARRVHQDIYGRWHPDTSKSATYGIAPEDDLSRNLQALRSLLYLAPDRLLYHWRDPVMLAWVRRVDVFEPDGLQKLNPFAEDLLRIEYEVDDRRHVVGFIVHNGAKWAAKIVERTEVPCQIHEGRKKKVD